MIQTIIEALNRAACKVMDNIILSRNHEITSTTQCSFAVNEVIKYYNHRGSQVYSIMLDASKAFDRVEYGRLFSRLMKKVGLCPLLVRFLV